MPDCSCPLATHGGNARRGIFPLLAQCMVTEAFPAPLRSGSRLPGEGQVRGRSPKAWDLPPLGTLMNRPLD